MKKIFPRLTSLRRPKRSTNPRHLLAAGAAGILLAYLFDPAAGRRRRTVGRDRMLGAARGAGRRLGRLARHVGSDASGLARRLARRRPDDVPMANDATLAQRVRSEIFRGADVPPGRVNVNVEQGVVVLRGELDRWEQVEALEGEARRVPGVRGVENLLQASPRD